MTANPTMRYSFQQKSLATTVLLIALCGCSPVKPASDKDPLPMTSNAVANRIITSPATHGSSSQTLADLTFSPSSIDSALTQAYDNYKGLAEGANADYIPALAKVDPNVYWTRAIWSTNTI